MGLYRLKIIWRNMTYSGNFMSDLIALKPTFNTNILSSILIKEKRKRKEEVKAQSY